MKIIHPSVEYWQQSNTLDGIWEHAARCARVCYQSQPVINGEFGKAFLLRTIAKNGFKKDKSSHMSVLEHATVYLLVNIHNPFYVHMCNKYGSNHYSKICNFIINDNIEGVCVTTNLRVIVENNWFDDLDYFSYNISQHIKRYTFSFITNLGVSRELNRHRCHSISEESTRYCNYSKNKFGNGLTFVIPEWLDLKEDVIDDRDGNSIYISELYDSSGKLVPLYDKDNKFTVESEWIISNMRAQIQYLSLLNKGWKPQQAREVLPLSLKTQVVHTAFEDDWKDFIALRSDGISGAPHPNIKVIADKIKDIIYDH